MGGVGMLGGDDLALPYPWPMRNPVTIRCQGMYPRTTNQRPRECGLELKAVCQPNCCAGKPF